MNNSQGKKNLLEKTCHMFLLGPETTIGQTIIEKVFKNFNSLQIMIPTGQYSQSLQLPPNHFPISDLSDEKLLGQGFAMCYVVVSCDPKYSSEKYQKIAQENDCCFINACISYTDAVISAIFERLPFKPEGILPFQPEGVLPFKLEEINQDNSFFISQTASFSIIWKSWSFAHSSEYSKFSFPRPKYNTITKKYIIDRCDLNISMNNLKEAKEQETKLLLISNQFAFSNIFVAYFFWFFTWLFSFIPFSKQDPNYESNWDFQGTCIEHGNLYRFEGKVESAKGNDLRPDIALAKTLEFLDFHGISKRDWGCCSKMKFEITSYDLVKTILMLGSPSSGKTTLINKINDYKNNDNKNGTKYILASTKTSCSSLFKCQLPNENTIYIQICEDNLSFKSKKLRSSLKPHFYHGVFIVIDLSNTNFNDFPSQLEEILKSFKENDTPVILIGNKKDQVEDINAFLKKCKSEDIKFVLTSAKTGDGINDMFDALIQIFDPDSNKIKKK